MEAPKEEHQLRMISQFEFPGENLGWKGKGSVAPNLCGHTKGLEEWFREWTSLVTQSLTPPFTPRIMPFLGFTRILSLYLGQTHYREKDELGNDPAWLPKNFQESAYIWVM